MYRIFLLVIHYPLETEPINNSHIEGEFNGFAAPPVLAKRAKLIELFTK